MSPDLNAYITSMHNIISYHNSAVEAAVHSYRRHRVPMGVLAYFFLVNALHQNGSRVSKHISQTIYSTQLGVSVCLLVLWSKHFISHPIAPQNSKFSIIKCTYFKNRLFPVVTTPQKLCIKQETWGYKYEKNYGVSAFYLISNFKRKFPYISVADKASDFKFGTQLGLAKDDKITPKKWAWPWTRVAPNYMEFRLIFMW